MITPMHYIIGSWLTSLKHYLLMCLLLSSPERLPYNPYPLLLTIFSYFLVGLLLVDEERNFAMVSAQILLEFALLGAIAYVGLRWRDKLPRLMQTFAALVGINLIVTVVTIPIYRMISEQTENPNSLLITSTIIILVWNLAIISMIFKRAFEISTQLSAMISFNYFVVYQFVVFWMY